MTGSPSQSRSVAASLAVAIAISFLSLGAVQAQSTGGSAPTPPGPSADEKLKEVKITLTAEQESLVDTLRTLMKNARLDFVIDADLKAGTATVHLKDIPFQDALATIVKVSTYPIKYEIKDGVYHFMHREDPPPAEKPVDVVKPDAPAKRADRVPVHDISSADALRKLTGPFDQAPPMLRYHSSQPISHGSTSTFGLNGNGLLQSDGYKYNPDGSVTRTGGAPINVFGLLRGLIGGFRR